MPSNVRYFTYLFYASLLVGVIDSAIGFQFNVSRASKIGGVVAVGATDVLVSVVPLTLVLLAAYRKRNWARWGLVGLFVLALLAAVPALTRLYRYAPHIAPLMTAGLIIRLSLRAAALYLVFSGNAKGWFNGQDETLKHFE